jgi:nitrogenase subunit NifH
MRKLMLLAAMVAIVLVAAAPAIAQVSQGFSQEDVESGGVSPAVGISNTGNNVNLCPTIHQSANSGNVQNEQGVVQYQVEIGDIGFGGSSITFETESAGECTQTIQQAASASG